MARRYSIAQARSQLPAIIDQAASGLEVELTRRGEPVAVVVSTREFDRLCGRRQHFSDAYQRFVAMYALRDIGLDAGFSKSVRDHMTGRHVPL
jgi:prevent-host-death family protein